MLNVRAFAFNPFQTNTYIISNEENNCIVIDPSFAHPKELAFFDQYIEQNKLTIVGVYNTHLHFDHCLGASHLKTNYGLDYAASFEGLTFLDNAKTQAANYGVEIADIPAPKSNLTENDLIRLGNQQLRILSTPGHADGSLCFVSDDEKFVITGDVLFRQSIGRTDLRTGNLDLLLESIHNKLFALGGDYKVYPGHGPSTTIAEEISGNPFLKFGEIH